MATNYLNENLKDQELVDVVSEDGAIIGTASRSDVYSQGLLHRAVNIVVFNKKGQIFIQRRSPKKILPFYWDISASEHVKSGESFKAAAVRGLKEEISVTAPIKLLRKKHIQKNEYKGKGIWIREYEVVELYGAVYNGKIRIDQDEVMDGKFIPFQGLKELVESNQIKFSPWGLDEVEYLISNPDIIAQLIR